MVAPVLLGIVVFGFWSMLKPHWVIERELLQMFRWTGDYFVGRMMMPGGLSSSSVSGWELSYWP